MAYEDFTLFDLQQRFQIQNRVVDLLDRVGEATLG